jgi:hypothetical protein
MLFLKTSPGASFLLQTTIMKLLLLFCCCLASLFSSGQPLREKIEISLDSFSLANPPEKTYLQTDRSNYLAGETIWFKSYITLFEKPGILSKVLYITLSNNKGKVLQKKQLQVINGSASGELEIPENTLAGEYYLHAYSLWMLNFSDFIHAKKRTIYNTETSKTKPGTPPLSTGIKLQFFPEAGQLVQGLASNVAFKAIDEYNRPVNCSGSIMNSKNKKLVDFTTTHNGMGMLKLQPDSGETYTAVLNDNVVAKNVILPAAVSEGITITADNASAGKAYIKLQRSQKNKDKYNKLFLVAQQNYQVVYTAAINFDEGQDAVAINKKNLPAGILLVTVFSESGIPLAERTLFVSNYTLPVINSSTINNTKRGSNSIEVDLTAFTNADAAVSVINSGAAPLPASETILSALLLSADIKGKIDEPSYYFKDKNPATIAHLDLLMMIHGWSRFKWEDVLESKFPALRFPFETGLSISGKVTHSNGKSALRSGKINLIIKGEDSTTILSEAAVNDQSGFVVPDLNFKKEATIFYQGTNQNRENALVSVTINPAYIDSLQQLPVPAAEAQFAGAGILPVALQHPLDKKISEYNDSKATLLKEVTVTSRKLSPADSMTQLYASAIFENSDQTLIMDQGNYFDIWQYLQRMVPGININKTDTGTQVNFSRYAGLNLFSAEGSNSAVQLFLNEVPVSSAILDLLNPDDVSLLKIYKGVTGIFLGADRGAIAIYTRKGSSKRDWREKGFDAFKKYGYGVNREFYAMDYSVLNPESSFSDERVTLYWNPHVTIKNGKALIEYYNDDTSRQALMILQGIDANGQLIYLEKLLQ